MITILQENILMPEGAMLPINDILGNNRELVLNENSKMQINSATYNATKVKITSIIF
jgi:hypothetical protein